MMKPALSPLLCLLIVALVAPCHAAPASQCVAAAHELQERFDHSIVKGWQLKFYARGENCDVLHVESHTNLTKQSMQALANGTMLYRKVVPEGVNKYAVKHGFKDVVYTNTMNSRSINHGARNLDKARVRELAKCGPAGPAKAKK
jgi:hypothetical protein